jgi:glutamyl-tRNA synthetase
VAIGRFAPSPTGDLHVGNLRTALVAWLCARSTGSRFVLRFEDLDRVTSRAEFQRSQANDLAAIGIDWDDEPLVQSDRFDAHHDAIDRLRVTGQTFECFCTRREVADAVHAPNGPDQAGRYPGTCRELTEVQRAQHQKAGRRPALRLHGDDTPRLVHDRFAGDSWHVVDDVVLRRNDGVPAYNLAVVIDDAFQGIEEVGRADDLLSSAAPQIRIAELLGLPPVSYVHIPLVMNGDGNRLAKRDGAVTLADLASLGHEPPAVLRVLITSLGLDPSGAHAASDLLGSFSVEAIPSGPWVWDPSTLHDN